MSMFREFYNPTLIIRVISKILLDKNNLSFSFLIIIFYFTLLVTRTTVSSYLNFLQTRLNIVCEGCGSCKPDQIQPTKLSIMNHMQCVNFKHHIKYGISWLVWGFFVLLCFALVLGFLRQDLT